MATARVLLFAALALPTVHAVPTPKCSPQWFEPSNGVRTQCPGNALAQQTCNIPCTLGGTVTATCDGNNWAINAGATCPAPPAPPVCPTVPYQGCCADNSFSKFGVCDSSDCQVFGYANSARSNCNFNDNNPKCGVSQCSYVNSTCTSKAEHCWGRVICPGKETSEDCFGLGMLCLEDGSSDNFKICAAGEADPCAHVQCEGNLKAVEDVQGQKHSCVCPPPPPPPPRPVCDPNPCKNGGECRDVAGSPVCKCLPGSAGQYCEVCAVGYEVNADGICCPIGCTCNGSGQCNGCQEEWCAKTNGICIYPGGPHPVWHGHGKPAAWPGARCVCPSGRQCCKEGFNFVRGEPGSPAYCCREGCTCDVVGRCTGCVEGFCSNGLQCHVVEGAPKCDLPA